MWGWNVNNIVKETQVKELKHPPMRKKFSQNNSSVRIVPYNEDEDKYCCCNTVHVFNWRVVSRGIVATEISTIGKELSRRVKFEDGHLHVSSLLNTRKICLEDIVCCNYVGSLITVHLVDGDCIVLVVGYESTARHIADTVGKYEI